MAKLGEIIPRARQGQRQNPILNFMLPEMGQFRSASRGQVPDISGGLARGISEAGAAIGAGISRRGDKEFQLKMMDKADRQQQDAEIRRALAEKSDREIEAAQEAAGIFQEKANQAFTIGMNAATKTFEVQRKKVLRGQLFFDNITPILQGNFNHPEFGTGEVLKQEFGHLLNLTDEEALKEWDEMSAPVHKGLEGPIAEAYKNAGMTEAYEARLSSLEVGWEPEELKAIWPNISDERIELFRAAGARVEEIKALSGSGGPGSVTDYFDPVLVALVKAAADSEAANLSQLFLYEAGEFERKFDDAKTKQQIATNTRNLNRISLSHQQMIQDYHEAEGIEYHRNPDNPEGAKTLNWKVFDDRVVQILDSIVEQGLVGSNLYGVEIRTDTNVEEVMDLIAHNVFRSLPLQETWKKIKLSPPSPYEEVPRFDPQRMPDTETTKTGRIDPVLADTMAGMCRNMGDLVYNYRHLKGMDPNAPRGEGRGRTFSGKEMALLSAIQTECYNKQHEFMAAGGTTLRKLEYLLTVATTMSDITGDGTAMQQIIGNVERRINSLGQSMLSNGMAGDESQFQTFIGEMEKHISPELWEEEKQALETKLQVTNPKDVWGKKPESPVEGSNSMLYEFEDMREPSSASYSEGPIDLVDLSGKKIPPLPEREPEPEGRKETPFDREHRSGMFSY